MLVGIYKSIDNDLCKVYISDSRHLCSLIQNPGLCSPLPTVFLKKKLLINTKQVRAFRLSSNQNVRSSLE